MTGMSRRSLLQNGGLIAAAAAVRPVLGQSVLRNQGKLKAFHPGEVWLDTAGKPIQAHAGSIIHVDDTFYWYGENKEYTDGKADVWTWGVRCYASKDFYNWDDLGLIIPPDTHDKASPLHPKSGLDRPHILYNSRSKKFVCWIKLLLGGEQTRAVLVSDKITGPYVIVGRDIRPLGMSAGDFDLVASPADGKAYMYFERVHSELICADLTDDYLGFTSYYSTHFPHLSPPIVREGPAYFYRRGKHYLATSGTTGYCPNPSEIAVADTFHGPFTVLGNLHPEDRSETSFNSQICSIFRHPLKQDLYIALADRWLPQLSGPDFESGKTSRLIRSSFAKLFASPREALTPDEAQAFSAMGVGQNNNTSISRYVWLPIHFEDDRPVIKWRDEWTIEEFA